MPTNLGTEECQALGMKFANSRMDNGEYRFRLMGPDGSGYIRTVMPETERGWQNAHYHKGVIETIIVQSGWIGVAELFPDGVRAIMVFEKNDIWTSKPDCVHNIYMPAGSVTHCVKHGDDVGNPEKGGVDWYPAPEDFDAWTKSIGEEDILWLASSD